MNIDIEETVKEEYELVGNDHVFGTYPTISEAVNAMQVYNRDFIIAHDMKIRHKLTAYIDRTVDCKELVK